MLHAENRETMQTILGAGGQIAVELARELHKHYTSEIRLVGRHPRNVQESDRLFAADLMNAAETFEAIRGSDIAYLTVGLPMETKVWRQCFPVIMKNVIGACERYDVKLVFFDNTYMYPQDDRLQTERTAFAPVGKKGAIRAKMAEMLLAEMDRGRIEAVICRAPEFYGPGLTKSITNSLVFSRIKRRAESEILLSDHTLRTLIWTPDAARATALIGNTPDAYGQTWHLPCDDARLTYAQIMSRASEVVGRPLPYRVLSRGQLWWKALKSKRQRELRELLPRYACDCLFDSTKFKRRFPNFSIMSYPSGIEKILAKPDAVPRSVCRDCFGQRDA